MRIPSEDTPLNPYTLKSDEQDLQLGHQLRDANSYSKQFAAYTILSLIAHLLWGLHPVFSRFLIVRAGFDSVVLLSALQLVCFVAVTIMGLFGWIAKPCFKRYKRRLLRGHALSEAEELQAVQLDEAKAARKSSVRIWTRKKFGTAILFGLVAASRSITNIESCAFTPSYNVQLISQLSPFVVSFMSMLSLGEMPPKAFWPATLLSTFGVCLVLLAQSGLLERSGHKSRTLTTSDWIGMLIQFTSVVFEGAQRVMMTSTGSKFSRNELMKIQTLTIGVLLAGVSLVVDPTGWLTFTELSNLDWAIFSSFSLAIFTFAGTIQVGCIRILGPGAYTSLQTIRILSTLLGAWLLMQETVQDPIEWVGIGMVALVTSVYLCVFE